MRTKFDFDFVTTATPDQVIELMTDFSPNRPHRWPASSVKAFEVYHLGETEADIREALSGWRMVELSARIADRDCRRFAVQGFRFPEEIISHAVWLYYRFLLSLRDVQDLLLERGIVVSHETIRAWCERFGPDYARRLRSRRPRPGDRWHLDEVFVKINGKQHYLWRAVDQHGNVLDVLVQSRRNAKAAERFFRKLLKGLERVPRVIVTDKLASYEVAHRRTMPSVEHRRSKYLNNRAENSHQPTRRRERAMQRFKSHAHAQRFLAVFSAVSPHFRPRRHLLSAHEYRQVMADRFTAWRQVTGTAHTS